MIVFSSLFDNKYKVEVVREREYVGLLTVKDVSGEILLSQEVSLSYNALFGPDVSDLHEWENIVGNFIDNREKDV